MTELQFGSRVNDFAMRAFRNSADKDYIAARLSVRSGLIPQFLWSSLQAFEKYFKYILLVNRIPSGHLSHNIEKSLELIRDQVPYVSDLRPDELGIFNQIANQGGDRYLIDSYSVHGHLLPELDAAIWDVRRYCQVILPQDGCSSEEQRIYELTCEHIGKTRSSPRKFRIQGGILEKIVADRYHAAHAGLCWQNGYFGQHSRSQVRAHFYLDAENAPLLHYPDMIDYLAKLIFIPGGSKKGYQQYLEAIRSGNAARF